MFSIRVKVDEGMGRWFSGLGAAVKNRWGRRRAAKQTGEPVVRKEPETEAERALYQAMGWKENAWED